MNENANLKDTIENEDSECMVIPQEEFNGFPTDIDYIEDNIVDIDIQNIINCKFDKDKFQEGIDSVSNICGAVSALVNIGITPSMALSFIAEREGSKVAIDIHKINSEAAIKSAKLIDINSQKNQL